MCWSVINKIACEKSGIVSRQHEAVPAKSSAKARCPGVDPINKGEVTSMSSSLQQRHSIPIHYTRSCHECLQLDAGMSRGLVKSIFAAQHNFSQPVYDAILDATKTTAFCRPTELQTHLSLHNAEFSLHLTYYSSQA
jgi:hypothetical protein